MILRSSSLSILLLLLHFQLFLSLLSPSTLLLVNSQVVGNQKLSRRELERRLQQLTDEALEALCTERGFEVITDELDDDTGQPVVSTHQDYVDAAWQCLQLEDFVVSDLYSKVAKEHDKQRMTLDDNIMSDLAAEDEEEDSFIDRLERIQKIAGEDYIPLPRPIKRLLGRIFIRMVKDVVHVVQFFRRQVDAIVGVLRDGIRGPGAYEAYEHNKVRESQKQRQKQRQQRQSNTEGNPFVKDL